MNGFFTWVKTKASAVVNSIRETASTVAEAVVNKVSDFLHATLEVAVDTVYFTNRIFYSPYFKPAREIIGPAWQAIKDIFNPFTLFNTLHHSKNSRKFLADLLKTNGILLLVVLANEAILKPNLRDESDPDSSTLELFVNNVIWALIMRCTLHNAIDRAFSLLSLTHVVTHDHPNNQNIEACRCAILSRIKSGLDFPVEYIAKLAQVYVFSLALGRWAEPLRWVAEGQNILSYKLDSAGICPTHQRELFSVNYVYTMVWGCLFTMSADGLSRMLSDNNTALYGPSYHLLYPFFVLAALSLTKPFPVTDKAGGRDIFKYSRFVTKLAVKETFSMIHAFLSAPSESNSLEKIKSLLAYAPPQLKQMTLGSVLASDLQSLEGIVTRPSINQWLCLTGNDIRQIIKHIKRIHGLPLGGFIPSLTHHLPISRAIHVLLGVLFTSNENFVPAFRKVDALIAYGLAHGQEQEKLKKALKYRNENFYTPTANANELTRGWEGLHVEDDDYDAMMSPLSKSDPSMVKSKSWATFCADDEQEFTLHEAYAETVKDESMQRPEVGESKDFAVYEEYVADPVTYFAAPVSVSPQLGHWVMLADDANENAVPQMKAPPIKRSSPLLAQHLFAHQSTLKSAAKGDLQPSYPRLNAGPH